MARTRDQFTGHAWLTALSTDPRPGCAMVYRVAPVQQSMDTLINCRLLVVCRMHEDHYSVTCYPRRDLLPRLGHRHAALYHAQTLAAALQAAINDYMHVATHVACAQFDTSPRARHVLFAEGEIDA